MLEIVLCDDNQKLLENYNGLIDRIIRDNSLNAVVKCLASNWDELDEFIKNDEANFFILDIDLKSKVSGYEIAEMLREKFKKSYIIFISGHLEYVFQAFKVRAFNFLPKPVSQEILEKTILEVYYDYLENYGDKPQGYLEVRSSGVLHKIKTCDIVSIERVETKSIIHLINGNIYCNDSLSDLYDTLRDKLNEISFVRSHKSYICNMNYVDKVHIVRNEVEMKNGLICFIGRKYKKEFLLNG